MSEVIKPAWVEAADEAKKALTAATLAGATEERDSQIRLAYSWMDISKLYKD